MDIATSTHTASAMNTAMSRSSDGKMAQAAKNLQNMDPKKLDKVKETAQEFEAVFISQMMSHMFNSVEVDPMFGGGQGEEMFRSMMVDNYGKELSQAGGIGIAEHVTAKLIDMQAAMNGPANRAE